jgi:hypothetical protein
MLCSGYLPLEVSCSSSGTGRGVSSYRADFTHTSDDNIVLRPPFVTEYRVWTGVHLWLILVFLDKYHFAIDDSMCGLNVDRSI